MSGKVVAVVERKSLPDLVSSLTSGRLRYALGELAIPFCETRKLAEEWTYRYLAAAHTWAETEQLALVCIGGGEDGGVDRSGSPRVSPRR